MPPATSVPFVPWPELEQHLKDTWQPGQHATLIGPTGAGKSHVALTLGEMCAHTVVLATKRRDELVSDLQGRGYVLSGSMDEIPYAEVHTGRGPRRVPVHRRVLIWANPQTRSERTRKAVQTAMLRQALGATERQGSWCVIVDEAMWLHQNLNLSDELDALWFGGRSSRVSVVACGQRPVSVPRQMIAQASLLLLWHIADRRDLEALREMGGVVPREVIQDTLPQLDYEGHEFLFVQPHTGYVARSVAPPR